MGRGRASLTRHKWKGGRGGGSVDLCAEVNERGEGGGLRTSRQLWKAHSNKLQGFSVVNVDWQKIKTFFSVNFINFLDI